MRKTAAAGGVVVGPHNKILIVNQNGDSWSLPKGHIDFGETAEDAARREVYEESGIESIKIIEKLGEYERFRLLKGGVGDDTEELKHITMFLCTTNHESLNPKDIHNPEARWVEFREVEGMLSHPKDKAFFVSVTERLHTFLRSLA